MVRTATFFLFTLASGCEEYHRAAIGPSTQIRDDTEQSHLLSSFKFDKSKKIIYLDTQIPPRQIERFDIGLGSVTLETLEVKDGSLVFLYTPEIEGGFTTYECTVPISTSPVTIKISSTPEETSFDLSKCRVVKSGNLHFQQ